MRLALILMTGLLLYGCCDIAGDAGTVNGELYSGIEALENGSVELEAGTSAMEDGRYQEARSCYSAAKANYLMAKEHFEEACEISGESPLLEDCSPDMQESIDDIDLCFIPTIDMLIAFSYLAEEMEDGCTALGCSEDVEKSCNNVLGKGRAVDARCGTDYTEDIEGICSKFTIYISGP